MSGFRWFDNLPVGRKIGLGFGLTVLLFAAVVLQYHQTLYRTLDSYDDLLAVAEEKKSLSLDIYRHMLEARRSEKDFLSRKKLTYVDRVKAEVALVLKSANALHAIETRAGGRPTARRIEDSIRAYHTAFQAIVAAWIERGLNHEQGLQGRFRETIHQVEAMAGNFKNGGLYLTLLQIRRNEKDLGLRRRPIYAETVRDLIIRFKNQTRTSAADADAKAFLNSGIEAYREHFEKFAALALNGGDIANGMGPFRDDARALEAFIAAHHVSDLEKNILSLRRHEKDFLLRGDKSYVKQVLKWNRFILNGIEASGITTADKGRLADLLRRYEEDFLSLVASNDRIIALTARMREAVHRIEPLAAHGLREAKLDMAQQTEATHQAARAASYRAIAMSSMVVLLAIFFAMLITRRIIVPVATLMGIAELVAGKDTAPETEEHKDEIAALAATMGRMAGSHRRLYSSLTGNTDELAAASTEITTISRELEAAVRPTETADGPGADSGADGETAATFARLRELTAKLNHHAAAVELVVRALKKIRERFAFR